MDTPELPEPKPQPDSPKLSQSLSQYHKAIESEFALNEDDAGAHARNKLMELLPEATKALENILVAGDSDTVRLSAVKLVFEHTLGKPGTIAAEDELSKLITSLTVTTTKKDKAK